MAKKIKNKLMYIGVAILGAIAGIVGLFLDIWNINTNVAGVKGEFTFNLFEEWPNQINLIYKSSNNSFSPIWATIFEIVAIATLVAVVAVIVLALIKQNKLAKLLAYVAVALAVVLVVSGCIFSIVNHVAKEVVMTNYAIDAKWAIGAWLIAVGGVVGATGCVMATKK